MASPAGPGRLLLLTGGDDQALALSLLQLGPHPASSSSNGSSGSCEAQCREVLRLSIPCAHSSALRALWLGSPQPAAAPEAALAEERMPVWAATAFSLGLDQQLRCWQLRAGPCRQQEPTSGGTGTGNGVPQGPAAARYCASSKPGVGEDGSSAGWQLEAEEAGCRFTQVVEPWALDVLPSSGGGQDDGDSGGARRYVLGVAGRGTEVLTWCV